MQANIPEIWQQFSEKLHHAILEKTQNAQDTSDILQEIFLKMNKYAQQIGKADNIEAYLRGIMRNTLADYFRKRAQHSQQETPLADLPDEVAPATETETLNELIVNCCLRPFIAQLPAAQSEALNETVFNQLSQKELAEKLHISYSGAKSRVQRAKSQLKQMIVDCCGVSADKYGNIIDLQKKDCDCAK